MDLIESDHWLFWPKVTVQVNLCQKHLFFNQLTHNMTTDCSLIPNFSAKKIQVQGMLCTKIVLNAKTKTKNQFLYTTCSELLFFSYWTRNSMNNLLSYCGLTDARISASEKDLPVLMLEKIVVLINQLFLHLFPPFSLLIISDD